MNSTTLVSLLIIALLIGWALSDSSYSSRRHYFRNQYPIELPRIDYDRPSDNIINYPRDYYDQAPTYGYPAAYAQIFPMPMYPIQYGYERQQPRQKRGRRPRFARDRLAKTDSMRSNSPERSNRQRQISSNSSSEEPTINN